MTGGCGQSARSVQKIPRCTHLGFIIFGGILEGRRKFSCSWQPSLPYFKKPLSFGPTQYWKYLLYLLSVFIFCHHFGLLSSVNYLHIHMPSVRCLRSCLPWDQWSPQQTRQLMEQETVTQQQTALTPNCLTGGIQCGGKWWSSKQAERGKPCMAIPLFLDIEMCKQLQRCYLVSWNAGLPVFSS